MNYDKNPMLFEYWIFLFYKINLFTFKLIIPQLGSSLDLV